MAITGIPLSIMIAWCVLLWHIPWLSVCCDWTEPNWYESLICICIYSGHESHLEARFNSRFVK
jgi:hypothetical protein